LAAQRRRVVGGKDHAARVRGRIGGHRPGQPGGSQDGGVPGRRRRRRVGQRRRRGGGRRGRRGGRVARGRQRGGVGAGCQRSVGGTTLGKRGRILRAGLRQQRGVAGRALLRNGAGRLGRGGRPGGGMVRSRAF